MNASLANLFIFLIVLSLICTESLAGKVTSGSTLTHDITLNNTYIECRDHETGRIINLTHGHLSFHILTTDDHLFYVLGFNESDIVLLTYDLPDTSPKACILTDMTMTPGQYLPGFCTLNLLQDARGIKGLYLTYKNKVDLYDPHDCTIRERLTFSEKIYQIWLDESNALYGAGLGKAFKIDLSTKMETTLFTLPNQPKIQLIDQHILAYNRPLLGVREPFELGIYPFKKIHSPKIITLPSVPFNVVVYEGKIFIFTTTGQLLIVDLTLGITLKTIPSLTGLFMSMIPDERYVYFEKGGLIALFDLKKQMWVNVIQRRQKNTFLCNCTPTHLLFSDNRKIPLFPTPTLIKKMIRWGTAQEYADHSPEAFQFQKDNLPKITDKEYLTFISTVCDTGRLCYERIFDFLDYELIPVFIACMPLETQKNYLTSGEWKLRRHELHLILCYRLWQQNITGASGLLKGLVLLDDPLALDLYSHTQKADAQSPGLQRALQARLTQIFQAIGYIPFRTASTEAH